MKLQVLVNDDLVKRIDDLASYIGVSRSSLCASMIVLAMPEWEKIYKCSDLKSDDNQYEQIKIDDLKIDQRS